MAADRRRRGAIDIVKVLVAAAALIDSTEENS